MVTLSALNPPQRQAVLHGDGPLVVFAGAGSGKTRVITHRIAQLVGERGVPPWRILAVTFTNKAAKEMRERLARLLREPGPPAPTDLPLFEAARRRVEVRDLWVGTFHATGARLLRRYADRIGIRPDFTIYDDGDQRAMVSRVLKALGLDDKRYGPKQVAARIERAKREVVAPADFVPEGPFDEVVGRIYAAYQEHMDRAGALDFGDLLFRLVLALEHDDALRAELAGRFEHVLVDEFQDTNQVQYRLLRAIAGAHQNLCVVGDDDQSIYRWRGADRRHILEFRREFPGATIIKLEQNYRSTQRILRAANAVIARNVDREPKALWTENEEGPKVVVVRCTDEHDEARMVVRAVHELVAEGNALADLAVFYRIHAQSRVLEEALRAENIPYRIVGGMRFYDRAEVKDLIAYLRVLHNLDDDVGLLRIVNTPARGIGKTTLDRLQDAAAQAGKGVWYAIATASDNPEIGTAARKKLGELARLIEELRSLAAQGGSLAELGATVLERTGYLAMLKNEDTPEADARQQNLSELVGSMEDFEQAEAAGTPTLASFLERVTLETSDERQVEGDRLTLMTVHAAKGLEFPVVAVVGLEEQMFPFRGVDRFDDPEELEEERRLAYVAFTRAQRRLVLSWAARRRLFRDVRVGIPSRFIDELPGEDVERVGGVPRPVPSRPVSVPAWREDPYAAMHRSPGAAPTTEWVDRSEGSDVHDVAIGMRVRHPKFGVGEVRGVTDGLPPRVTVHFPGWGAKKIVASFLEPL